jgi:hypothetical protein
MSTSLTDVLTDVLTDATIPASASVTAELWISFVALLRSHLGALQTTGKLARVMLVETSSRSLRVGDLSGNLELTLDLATGAGSYQQQRCGEITERGSWTLHPDATAGIDNKTPLDMEFVVEAFAYKLEVLLQGDKAR